MIMAADTYEGNDAEDEDEDDAAGKESKSSMDLCSPSTFKISK